MHTAQQVGNAAAFMDQWREIESLLAIVGPAYRTPEQEYVEMRSAARGDLANALPCFRELARQIAGRPNCNHLSEFAEELQ